MAKLTVEGVGEFDVPPDKRLVNALEDEAKIDQLHACGGFARCTTCRVQFLSGEPKSMTEAEEQVLTARGLIGQPGLRLSCQIPCEQDMEVRAISRLSGSGRPDPGKRPADELTPPPQSDRRMKLLRRRRGRTVRETPGEAPQLRCDGRAIRAGRICGGSALCRRRAGLPDQPARRRFKVE